MVTVRNFLLETRSVDPYYNLALEECLFGHVGPGEVAMYLWQNENTVVIGRNQNAWRECRCARLEADGGRLARRGSGGGAVFHDLGNLNFTFVASPERYDFAKQCGVITDALSAIGIRAKLSGRNDMILEDGRKFSGNAFKHTKQCSLQHGTLLISADMEKLGKYLNPSAAKLRAKGVASVKSRVCNLSEVGRADNIRPYEQLTPELMRALLIDSFERVYGEYALLDEHTFDGAVLASKRAAYASWDWIYGLTPEFDARLNTRFEWGELEILLKLKNGVVESARVHSDAMDAELPDDIAAALLGREYGPALATALPDIKDADARKYAIDDISQWLIDELS